MLKHVLQKRSWSAVVLSLLLLNGLPAGADEPAVADPLAVPATGTAAEYIEFIQAVAGHRPSVRSREELIEYLKKAQASVSQAATKALADKNITEEQAQIASEAKFAALLQRQRLGDEAASAELKEFTAALSNSPKPALAALGKRLQMQLSAMTIGGLEPAERKQVADQLLGLLEADGIGRENFSLAIMAGQQLEQADAALAGDYYTRLAALAAKSDNPPIAAYGQKLEGVARRLKLLGNKMELAGEFLDGAKLDWDSYRGKVVLVDFWATWCGPCIAELPNIKENYEAYHKKGFEVIGISLDDAESKANVEKFLADRKIPWPTLFSSDEATSAWNHPMANRYGILGIPTAILVDQQGKVVDLHARGPALGEKLAELLGEPAAAAAP